MSAVKISALASRGCSGLALLSKNLLPLSTDLVCDVARASLPESVFMQAGCQKPQHTMILHWLTCRGVHQDHHHAERKGHPHIQQDGDRRPLTLEEMEKACWSCDKHVKRGGLVCNGCETIQPPDESLNYFELFSLSDKNFDVNPQQLERRYKQLQWNLHPDKMGHKPAEEREFSAQQASIVNLAYSILKSPLSRANYLLALRGISAGDNFEGTIEDQELLMEVLEAREVVESTDDPATLSTLLASNRRQQQGLVAALSAAFRSEDMKAAVSLTNQLQYVAKLEQEIIRKLPELPQAV